MSKKIVIAVIGLLMFCVSQGWCGGSMGNGAAQRATMASGYTFCYAGNLKVIYMTQIVAHLVLPANAPNLGVTYAEYVKKTYGLSDIDRDRCITSTSNVVAETVKQRYKRTFSPAKFIETEWAVNSAAAH